MRSKYKSFKSIFGMIDLDAPTVSEPTHFRHASAHPRRAQRATHVAQPVKSHPDGGNGWQRTDHQTISDKAGKILWRGKSGRFYQLMPQNMEKLYFDDTVIVLAQHQGDKQRALWVGNMSDIVCEPTKREIYKKAVDEATMVYKIVSSFPACDMAGTIWDVEQGALA